MASLYPDSLKAQVVFASSAERNVYHAIRKQLDDTWSVFYSVVITEFRVSGGVENGEMDFVLFHPSYGIIVLEVKGGRISFEQEQKQFYSINRFGQRFRIKDPYQQALVWKSRLIRKLKEIGAQVPVTHAVCLPNVGKEELPKESNHDLSVCREDIEKLPGKLVDLVKQAQPERFLNFTVDQTKIRDLMLGASFETPLYMREYLERHEHRVFDLESVQANFIAPIAKASRLGIEGEAGTGKTILARLLAKHFADKDMKVLFLTSNKFLQQSNKAELPQSIEFATYVGVAQWFGVNLLNPPASYKDDRSAWVKGVGPEKFLEGVRQSSKRFDVLICDEAQDVEPNWWNGFEALLKVQAGSLFTFFDRSQGVFSGAQESFRPETTLPVPENYFPLVNNYRMTQQISDFAAKFKPKDKTFESHSGRIGYQPSILPYQRDSFRKLESLVEFLVNKEKVDPKDITILSARHPDHKASILHKRKNVGGLKLSSLKSLDRNDGEIAVSTIQGFKGLESPVVILVNISEYNLPLEHPLMRSLLYVGITRAKHMTYLLADEKEEKFSGLDTTLSQIQSGSEIIIDSSENFGRVSGRVTYYNPKRFGYLECHDERQNGKKSKIIFFPSDLGDAVYAIKLKDEVSFLVDQEAGQLFAKDLKVFVQS